MITPGESCVCGGGGGGWRKEERWGVVCMWGEKMITPGESEVGKDDRTPGESEVGRSTHQVRVRWAEDDNTYLRVSQVGTEISQSLKSFSTR